MLGYSCSFVGSFYWSYLDEEKKNATFLNQLITKVVDNLQVSINNIHVRYEDKLSDPKVRSRHHAYSSPFFFSWRLCEFFHATSLCDATNEKQFVFLHIAAPIFGWIDPVSAVGRVH
jgi:hypothetical protein